MKPIYLRPDGTQLYLWVIYFNPKDYPGEHVARRHGSSTGPDMDAVIRAPLERLRFYFDFHKFIKLERSDHDDPCIVETWV